MNQPVRVLAPEVARKIAAGEVIDRPAAVVRELLDNAIDSGATDISVKLEDGGIQLVETADDGAGMNADDIALCWLPHATSKIRNENDLLSVSSLGFRGEALPSMAAVARLELISAVSDGLAKRVTLGPGAFDKPIRVENSQRKRGTTVRVYGLFDSFPARKRFLKRASAEGSLCKQALLDKALAFPKIAFRLSNQAELKLLLNAEADYKARFSAAHPVPESAFLRESFGTGDGFSFTIVVGGPEWYRNDRRLQYVFVNGRRIQDFSLLHALEYGTRGFFPNGVHPVGAVYIDIDPALVDFNIHPAKREARFKDQASIHRALCRALEREFSHYTLGSVAERGAYYAAPSEYNETKSNEPALFSQEEKESFGKERPHTIHALQKSDGSEKLEARLAMSALLEGRYTFAPLPSHSPSLETSEASEASEAKDNNDDFHFLGTVFGLFLAVERGDRFFLIDQHAAHERILFERFLASPPPKQDLLVPYPFTTADAETDSFLAQAQAELAALGVVIERDGDGWILTALPTAWGRDDGSTIKSILDLKDGKDLARDWLATLACRAAVKDGDSLDTAAAAALAQSALALPVALCPHGRPLYFEITRDELWKAVRRSG